MPENDFIINRVKSLSLYELIGAPLQALVQAEAQAMQSTVDYIRVIGFENDGDDFDIEKGPKLGNLKMLSFTYTKRNEEGKEKERTFKIPLLSLIPIPLLTVKNAEIEFSLKVADFYFEKGPKTQTNSLSNELEDDKYGYLSGKRAAIKATMGTMGKEEMQQTQYQIRVKMNVEQSDMPAGLQKMMNNMTRNIEDQ